MKKLTLVLALLILSSPAHSIDSGRFDYIPLKCSEVLKSHASLRDKGKRIVGDNPYLYWHVVGYMQGYLSAKNQWKVGKQDWFKGNSADNYLLNWSASYCRSNPSHDLKDALESFSGN